MYAYPEEHLKELLEVLHQAIRPNKECSNGHKHLGPCQLWLWSWFNGLDRPVPAIQGSEITDSMDLIYIQTTKHLALHLQLLTWPPPSGGVSHFRISL